MYNVEALRARGLRDTVFLLRQFFFLLPQIATQRSKTLE